MNPEWCPFKTDKARGISERLLMTMMSSYKDCRLNGGRDIQGFENGFMDLKECGRLTDVKEDRKATLSDSTEYMRNQVNSLINENGRTTRRGIDKAAIGSQDWMLKE